MSRVWSAPLLLLLGTTLVAAEKPGRPNIVFILADDLGWTDLGCQGSRYYRTPNIDRLAGQGMRFTAFHVCQNCTPTRAALMSGQYPPRTGIYSVGTLERGQARHRKMEVPENVTKLPLDRLTVADVLKQSGYATGMFGKWHLGQDPRHHPAKRGFDEAIVSMGRHFDFNTTPPVEVPKGAYLADFLTDLAVRFIEKNRDKPFFLYLPHFAVHSPHQAKPELLEKYRKLPPAGGHQNPTYAAMIDSLDQSVGKVMEKLHELKLTGRTLIIFSSDNGGVGGYDREGLPARNVTDNAPLRGGKGMLYEGGVRVPFIVRWPGVIKPGTTCDVPAIHVDLFPTLAEAAGAKLPAKQILDGESLVPLFRDASAKLKRQAIFAHMPGYLEGGGPGKWRTTPAGSIQVGEWKLLEFFETGKLELYNLKHDPGEKNDLAKKEPARVQQLHARLRAWRQELKAAMPVPRKTQPEKP